MSNPLNGILGSSGGGSGGSGDVVGPAASTDNAIARWDLATGKLLQDSSVLVPDGLSGTVVVGSTGSTDNILLRSDGTGAATLQASDLSISDPSGSVTTISSVGGNTINISPYLQINGGGSFYNSSGLIRFNAGLGINGVLVVSSSSYSGIEGVSAGVLRVLGNGAAAGSIGSLLAMSLVEANTAGSGTPNAIAATESGTVFTNEGSGAKNYEALPTAAAGYRFTFIVQDADGMRIVANTDDTIRVIDKVTAASGYIESTTIGSTVTLVSINAVEWYATSIHGVWSDGTWTYDDTSLTTP